MASFKKKLFIFNFLAVLGLHCCAGFSLVSACSVYSLVAGSSLVAYDRLLGRQASVVAVHGLSGWGSWALEHRLNS